MKRKSIISSLLVLFLFLFPMAVSAVSSDDIYSKLTEISYIDEDGDRFVQVKNAAIVNGVIYEYHKDTDSFTACAFDKDTSNCDVIMPSKIFGKKVTDISYSLFDYDNNSVRCKTVIFPDTITRKIMLHGAEIDHLVLSNNMKTPGEFRDCAFRSVILPKKAVKSGKFINCTKLRQVMIGSKVNTIESFRGCSNLSNLWLPSSVKTIQAEAFKGCTSLELYVPASVKKIGKNAFGSNKSNRIKRLYCVKNSAAHKTAKKNGIPYTLIKDKGKKIKLTGITVSSRKLTMVKGESTYLNVKAVPFNASEQKFLYESSNPEAVSVDEYGKIAALKFNSSAVITVRSATNKKIKSQATVKVKKAKSESFTLTVNGKKYIADLNGEGFNRIVPLRLEDISKFRVYETTELKKYDYYGDPYWKSDWKLVKETTKNKLSIKSKKKKYYRIEYWLRPEGKTTYNSWYILCGATRKM